MKIGADVTLGAAAAALERKLCAAAHSWDAQQIDHLLDLLRALSLVEDMELTDPDRTDGVTKISLPDL